ncbi:uncharacterized protein LOC122301611 [Carya illinoinensis]|uniref:uncharacterized protein LOC122301611 n=1 Tax=Carya illinoinensis TaxID=32201 RepID=UPI001C71F5DD|nr:uncharacterized protein LOC122301611 [Carya illinoinensis]
MKLPSFANNVGVGGKIWLFWEDEIDFEFIAMSDQAISGWFIKENKKILVTLVYASCFREKRLELWDFLRGQNSGGSPWFVGGDFNIIRYDNEKIGGLLRAPRAKRDFNDCIHDCALMDIPCIGNKLSWCNGRRGGRRIWARLDRVMVNLMFSNLFGDVKLSYLPRTSSDRAPMLITLTREREVGVRPFRFLWIWGSHDSFIPMVQDVWNSDINGCAMVRISRKLKVLKGVLRKGNKETFGRVEEEIKRLEGRMVELELNITNSYSE